MFYTLAAVYPSPRSSDLKIIGFLDTVSLHWNFSPFYANATKTLSDKFKQVRAGLKVWSKKLSNLSKLIYNYNWVLLLLDGLEDQRPLSRLETIFRVLVKNHLATVQESKRTYWRQRNTVRWVKFGDENSSFFTLWLLYHIREISFYLL